MEQNVLHGRTWGDGSWTATADPLKMQDVTLIGKGGGTSGTAKDSEETLAFSAQAGVRPMIERYPLEKAAEAYDQMISGRVRFRVVLTM